MSVAAIIKPDPDRRDINDNRLGDMAEEIECRVREPSTMRTPLVIPEPRRLSPVLPGAISPGRISDRGSPSSSPALPPDVRGLHHLPWTTPMYPCFPHPLQFLPYRVPGIPLNAFPDHFAFRGLPDRLGLFPHNSPLAPFPFQGAIPPYMFSGVQGKGFGLETRNIDNEMNIIKSSAFDMVKPKEMTEEHEPQDTVREPAERVERSPERKKTKDVEQTKYKCGNCQKNYSTFSGLSKHKQFHCSQDTQKEFTCKYCDKTYVSLGALKMHIRTHTLPCKCKICGKAFSRPWLLQGHIRTHTGEKPFSCVHCLRAFADRSNLRAHLQTHSDVKKYSCKTCNKTFSRMSLLLKHEDSCSVMDM